ncbi:MAG: hypothetical protein R2744_09770 [Bacteroidales bacterium]
MKKILVILMVLVVVSPLYSQGKFKAGVVAFYNLENLFDTINTDGVLDEEFTPDGPNKWDGRNTWRR